MSDAMVRVSEHTREILREIAQAQHESMQAVLEKAVEEYRRQRYMESLNAFYADLRKDPEAWAAEKAERALWDKTLMDGLPDDEIWDPETRTARIVESKRTK